MQFVPHKIWENIIFLSCADLALRVVKIKAKTLLGNIWAIIFSEPKIGRRKSIMK